VVTLVRLALLGLIVWLIWGWLERRGLAPRRSMRRSPKAEDPVALDPWSVLGVEQGASQSEIRKAFHQRMSEYHPDKVSALGAELRELADAKSKQINRAYEQLRKD